jgi:hypothetical protein
MFQLIFESLPWLYSIGHYSIWALPDETFKINEMGLGIAEASK